MTKLTRHRQPLQLSQSYWGVLVKRLVRWRIPSREYAASIFYNSSTTLEISIQDNGIGIPQNIVDKIFDPFFTTKPQGRGTGVGLYFAHDLIVARNRGQIIVDSKLGVYTTFTIILPKNVA